MPTPTSFIFKTTGAAGDVIDLGDEFNQVSLTFRVAAQAQKLLRAPGTAAPSTPTNPVPAAGAKSAAGWIDAVATDVVTFEPDATGQTKYRYIPVYSAAASGIINVECK